MALSEFVAIETAYRALVALDPGARVRALGWLTDALGTPGVLAETPAGVADVSASAPELAAPTGQASRSPAVRRSRRTARQTATKATARSNGAAAKTASSPQRSRAAKPIASVKAVADGERAYRRMPPAAEVLGAYRQVGTVSGLAEHFGVPRHTVQGWARRLRQEGHKIGSRA
jgi:hypothetical protein